MHSIRTGVALQSIAIQIAIRADVDPRTGDYAPLAMMPDIEDEDMIYYDVIFPLCLTYGSTGVPKYLTDKSEVLSGNEQRETRYKYPRHEFSIAMENLPADEAADVLNIWHICSGDFAGFLFLDPQDHTSSNSGTQISGTDITNTDQIVASAVGSVTEYPLYKYYTHGSSGRQKQRRIGFPKADTLLVAVDGYAILSWEYDFDRRVLRFTKPQPSVSLDVTLVDQTLTSDLPLGFAELSTGDLIYLTGFAASVANTSTSLPHRVVAKLADDTIVLQRYNGTDIPSGSDEAGVTVTLESATPPTNSAITAGFYFYVPVRFDEGDSANSEIIAGLRETAITTFGDIKLREVFE
jgi:uncharacterized protein (TIGR02217 family)